MSLTFDERKKTIDDIFQKLKEKGEKINLGLSYVQEYELELPARYVHVCKFNLKDENNITIKVAEKFVNPSALPEYSSHLSDLVYYSLLGLRAVYKGGYEGLDEINLQGYSSFSELKNHLFGGCFLKSKTPGEGLPLTQEEIKKFDTLLKLIQSEL